VLYRLYEFEIIKLRGDIRRQSTGTHSFVKFQIPNTNTLITK